MSFLQAHQVLTYESTENRVLGFLGEVGMTTPEDPGEYSRLSGTEPNRFVSGAALFLYICFGFAKYLLGDCAVSKDRQKIRRSDQPTPLLLCARWFIGRGVEYGFSGASGECGAVHLFNVPSMTTGDRENSRVFFQLFSSILPEQY